MCARRKDESPAAPCSIDFAVGADEAPSNALGEYDSDRREVPVDEIGAIECSDLDLPAYLTISGDSAVSTSSVMATQQRRPDARAVLPYTQQLAARLVALAEPLSEGNDMGRKLRRFADRLLKCSARRNRKRVNPPCGLFCCPACQKHVAVRFRKRLEAIFKNVPSTRLCLLRFSANSTDHPDHLGECRRVLADGLKYLRRRALWKRAVVGGAQFVDLATARIGAKTLWNCHAHVVVELRPGTKLRGYELAELWRFTLDVTGAFGSSDAREEIEYRNEGNAYDNGGKFSGLACYVSRRKRGTELLSMSDIQLLEWMIVMAAKPAPRLVAYLGAWSKRSRRRGRSA